MSLLPFGVPAWVKVVDAGKLNTQVKPGCFVSYDAETRGYRIYLLNSTASAWNVRWHSTKMT